MQLLNFTQEREIMSISILMLLVPGYQLCVIHDAINTTHTHYNSKFMTVLVGSDDGFAENVVQ